MLLSMPAIGQRINAVLDQWLSFSGDERRAVSLLVGLIREHTVSVDLRFLAAAQALEALSRVEGNQNELDEDEFRRRLRIVRDSVPEARVRDWADRKLKYANDRSAGELFKDLAARVGDYVDILAPAKQAFFDDIRNNRNFYTHRDSSRVERVLEGEKLYVLTQGVIALLEAAVLRRLGFSQQDTRSVMEACQGALQWRLRVAKQYERPDGGLA
jgi:hypothetical protein